MMQVVGSVVLELEHLPTHTIDKKIIMDLNSTYEFEVYRTQPY